MEQHGDLDTGAQGGWFREGLVLLTKGPITHQGRQGRGSLALGADLHGAPALALLTDLPLAAQQPHPVGKQMEISDRRPQEPGPCTKALLVRNM